MRSSHEGDQRAPPSDARTWGVRWEPSPTRTRCLPSRSRPAFPSSGQQQLCVPPHWMRPDSWSRRWPAGGRSRLGLSPNHLEACTKSNLALRASSTTKGCSSRFATPPASIAHLPQHCNFAIVSARERDRSSDSKTMPTRLRQELNRLLQILPSARFRRFFRMSPMSRGGGPGCSCLNLFAKM